MVFDFANHVITEHISNQILFDTVIDRKVDKFLQGFNLNICAYGQTDGGKTHTILGKIPKAPK